MTCAAVLDVTAAAVAANLPDVLPAAIVTDAGTVNLAAEEASDTTAPPAGAAAERIAVHVEVPGDGIVTGLHTTEVNVGGVVLTVIAVPVTVVGMPLPCKLAATPFVIKIGTLPEAVGVSCTATFATMPFAMTLVLIPVSRHVVDSALALH